jgi:hypothetical protein
VYICIRVVKPHGQLLKLLSTYDTIIILTMENKILVGNNRIMGNQLIRYLILIYWLLFWLLNILDKIIGGSHFLWVGKDRFAQFERFFDSLGLGSPIIASVALIITAGLEIFAFVFFSGALYYLIKKKIDSARSWFFIGVVLTLIIFTYFSIGDQIFGDHIELLEHGIYWFITLLSWVIFIRIDKSKIVDDFSIKRKQFLVAIALMVILISITTFSIFRHNQTSFIKRTEALKAMQVGENRYKFSFPFLAGSKAFENTIAKFKEDNPTLRIKYIYTAPTPLRLGEADGLIIYVQTDSKK